MEDVLPVRQSRSLVRRVAVPLSLSLAVLSGGGWGVYRFTAGSEIEPTAPPSATAHSAQSAKDELKNLFATKTSASESNSSKAAAIDTQADRYALKAEEPSRTLAAVPQLPPAQSSIGGRYATAPTRSTLPMESPTPAQVVETAREPQSEGAPDLELTSQDPTRQDIARGQEPDGNPLRSPAKELPKTSDVANAIDAQTAFGQNEKPAPAAPPVPVTAKVPGNPDGKAPAALLQARPLPQKSAASQKNNRYQAAEPTLGSPTAAGIGPANTEVASRSPAPAFGFEQPNPVQQERTPSEAKPIAAPLVAGNSVVAGNLGNESITPTPGLTNRPGTGRPGEQLLEGAQSPSITIQKLAPKEIQVGKRCTFAVRVQNTGQRTAQNVRIHDEVPLGTELVGTAPRAAVSGSSVVWDVGTLSVGEERTVEMELIPIEEGELGSVATVTLAAQASAKSRCTRPELALRLSCSPQVLVGQKHVVQIEISNPGSGDATGVMLLESLPTGVSHEAGPALEYEIGTLRPGESRRMELFLTAEQAGKISNVMTARADANLRVDANCEFEIIAPELRLSIEGPQRRYLERPATYQINVDNPGTATAQEVQLVTRLPKGLQFVSANNLGEYDSSTHSVQWSLAELPANERGTVELVALPIEAGEQILQASTNGKRGLEDRTEKSVHVEGLAALTFEVTDLEGLIEVGGETTYEIVVANQGSKSADNVQIVAIMPPGMRALSGQGETQHTIQGERVTFAPLPQLAPKAEMTFRIQAQGISPGDQRVRVMIQTDELHQPITKEVNTRVYADE